MSNDRESFGSGFICAFVLIAFFALVFLAGWLGGLISVTGDCTDFGKTQIKGTWYECRRIEKK